MKIYLVMKNTDFTEGRGTMFIDKAFLDEEHAVEYVMQHYGIMGTKQEEYTRDRRADGTRMFNGYEIRPTEVLETPYTIQPRDVAVNINGEELVDKSGDRLDYAALVQAAGFPLWSSRIGDDAQMRVYSIVYTERTWPRGRFRRQGIVHVGGTLDNITHPMHITVADTSNA